MTSPISRALQTLELSCAACRNCGLAEERQQVVVGRGNPEARLMLIGEAPGAEEDASGLPFVGRSGQLLSGLIAEAGLDEDHDLYICNVIKCRPPGNRKPTAQEMDQCRPWLEQQLTLINPPLVLLAGATALQVAAGDPQRHQQTPRAMASPGPARLHAGVSSLLSAAFSLPRARAVPRTSPCRT